MEEVLLFEEVFRFDLLLEEDVQTFGVGGFEGDFDGFLDVVRLGFVFLEDQVER